MLRLAAALESRSEHPIGRAIRRAARDEGIEMAPCDAYQALPGLGAAAEVDGAPVLVGNHRLFEERGLCIRPEIEAAAAAMAGDDRTIVLVAAGGTPVGVISCGRCRAPERPRGHRAAAPRRHSRTWSC